jgi:hypothetical protein
MFCSASKVCVTAILLLLIAGNLKYDIGVTPNGIIFVSSFVKTSELAENFKGETGTAW